MCDGGTPTDPDPEPAPTTGTLEVSAATTGDTLDADGYTVTLDGGDERALDRDGTVVFEDLDEGDHEVALGGVQVNCELDGGTARTVAVTAGETATVAFDVACAPALFDRIVFDSDRTGDFELFVMETDGANPTALGGGEPGSNAADPSVSPDGTRVLFRSDRTGNLDVFTMAVDGSDVVNLTDDPANDVDPAWSPDGERIAFRSERGDGSPDIWVMNADGTGLVEATGDAGPNMFPDVGPDGGRIAFISSRDGDFEIFTIGVDGSGPLVNLTANAARDFRPAWTPARAQR